MAIRIGTASWTDKSLVDSKLYYPSSANTAEARLRYYAADFPLVEIDSSYYGIPTRAMAQAWVERTPADFRFNVKAFRIFTGHQTAPAAIPKDIREALPATGKKNVYYKDLPAELRSELWERFRLALEPLHQAGKLGAIHLQYPPWMAFHPDSFAHVQDCREQLADYRLAVEFRNASWFNERHRQRTLDFERELGVAHVVLDEAQGFASSVPAIWEATSPELAVVRLHGRNAETWEKKGLKASSERFNYDYSEPELAEFKQPVKRLAGQVAEVNVIFNNNYQDQGQRNALTLSRILQAELEPRPLQ